MTRRVEAARSAWSLALSKVPSEHRELWGRNAQRRVNDEFLIFPQLRQWIRLLGQL